MYNDRRSLSYKGQLVSKLVVYSGDTEYSHVHGYWIPQNCS